jgi:hypothetical protein
MNGGGVWRAYVRLARLYWPLTVVLGVWAALLLGLGVGLGWLVFA